ncbi:hybrid sensor histidine kinase/response regulator [Psychromonas sp. psych-6C06]|uniref:PAS domain S-box protein n=1 Tax=Psychromonas sp. psych-6C06 TaxID=2058089 RepID=UPI000C31CA42|nr:PAS domain S-box protein [Psychromonas sp. psych-6C06]PKF62499.1 hybrid sensor histidine kinase/response regulator [Psychromonas sp. psych-6C06]
MSFRLKIILGIAFIESALLILLILSGMSFLSDTNEAQLKHRAEATSLLFAKAVKNPLISSDLATLESFTQDILTLPEIAYARISNNDFILAEGGIAEFLNRPHVADNSLAEVDDGTFDIVIDITEGGTVFGTVEIGLSTDAIKHSIYQAQSRAIVIACLEVLLVGIFSFMLVTYLTQQLRELKKASDKISISGPGHQVKVTGKDEIAEVANAFNSMSSTLASNYQKLSESIDAERKMSAIAKRNQAQNHAILSASLDALITIDQAGKVVDFNNVAEVTFGWKYDEIFGKNLADFIIPKNKRSAHHAGMQHFILNKESPVINQRLQLNALHKLGHSFPIEINIAPIETEQGLLFTAFIRDISTRLEAEAELRIAAQTFESSEAMFISDAQGNIIRVNHAFTNITGYGEQDVLGQNPKILSSGLHPTTYYQSMWTTLVEQGKWSGEIYNKRKNGEIYPEYLNISAVKDESGETSHYIAHFMDISEQKNNEENLRKARLEAEASNESKSRFLASMSHEIRTPMNAVLGILDLLKDTQLTEKQLTLISTARDSGELLMTIINDILDFTKMDIDEKVLQLSVFDLHRLLNNCTSLLKHLADKKALNLRIEQSSDLPQFVQGDPDRIQQILINLINNAIKFTEQGEVSIIASLDSEIDGKFILRIKINDTGIGIAQDNQAILFEEFTMVDQSHSRRYEGTGLGLAICKRLITLMNGEIKVCSELGKGSSFEFTIMLDKADENNIQQTIERVKPQKPRSNIRLLLAEDNLANQMVIKSILEFSGLQVDVVNNGYEALQAVQKSEYDIVLMDISMPEMDGMSATKAIRALSSPVSQLPIIALTAHTLSGDKERFIEAGMNDYLSKPINRSATLSCIARWTERRLEPRDETQNTAQADESDSQYVDESILIQLVNDTDAEIVPELIRLYVEDSEQRMQKIELAITESDIATLEFETHTIGSSAVAHGNAKLYKLARSIEHQCRENEHEQALKDAKQLLLVAKKSFSLLTTRAQKGFG